MRVAKKGQKAYRFDAPNGEFGVMYCAFTLEVCFAETLLRTRAYRTPADEPTLIDESELRAKGIAKLSGGAGEQLVLADLTGSGLARLHADGSISTALGIACRANGRWRYGSIRSAWTASGTYRDS
jgi:RES domain